MPKSVAELIQLKTEQQLTYQQLADLVGVPATTLCGRFRRAGHVARVSRSRTPAPQFWQTANTAMALIRSGRTNLTEIASRLGKSKTATHSLIHRLVALGLVAHVPGQKNTFHLTSPEAGSLVRFARRRPDGVIESFKGGK